MESRKRSVANSRAIGNCFPHRTVAVSSFRWRTTVLPVHSPVTVLQQPVSHWPLNIHPMFGHSTVQSGQADGIRPRREIVEEVDETNSTVDISNDTVL